MAKGQFRKGFNQSSKAGLHHVQAMKLGEEKVIVKTEIVSKHKESNHKVTKQPVVVKKV